MQAAFGFAISYGIHELVESISGAHLIVVSEMVHSLMIEQRGVV